MAKLELHDVRKSYGSVEVIPGVDLAIETGEFLVLVGPSGSGKSTLLRMIAGLEDTNAGRILIDGEDITNVDPSARDLAMVFQSYALYPHMTVAQNMSFALRMRKEDPAEIERRVKAAVEMLGLAGLEQRRPGQLSGGQRQRVAMGRCIVRNPKLFLFDEPLSNLDAKLRAQTRLEIRRLHDRLGATSIFVTHDQVEAMTMADRIALLKDGRLQQIGSPQELYLEPANAFVATFMGTPEMNMFEGRLGWAGETARLEGPQPMALPVGAARSARLRKAPVGEITIGVRPEHFVQVAPETAGALAVRVSSVEWLGHDIFAFGDAGGRLVSFRQSQVDADGGTLRAPQAGETVHLLPMADRWHAFGGPGGVNLLV